MKYNTIPGVPEGILRRGPGFQPSVSASEIKLRILTVKHPKRKEYIVLDFGPTGLPDEGQVARLVELDKCGYILTCGYLNYQALNRRVTDYATWTYSYLRSLLPHSFKNVSKTVEVDTFFDVLAIGKEVTKKVRLTGDAREAELVLTRERDISIFKAFLLGSTSSVLSNEYGLIKSRVHQVIFSLGSYFSRAIFRKYRGEFPEEYAFTRYPNNHNVAEILKNKDNWLKLLNDHSDMLRRKTPTQSRGVEYFKISDTLDKPVEKGPGEVPTKKLD